MYLNVCMCISKSTLKYLMKSVRSCLLIHKCRYGISILATPCTERVPRNNLKTKSGYEPTWPRLQSMFAS